MNLEQFRYIKEVVQCRSISKAAKQLFLTQPTISNAIHNFEEEVGYKVFRRSNQGVELTEDGEKLMGSIDIILHEVENIRNSKEGGDYINGDVYVDASPAICSTILPKVIIACKQAYPGITVHVKETFPDKSMTSLLAGMSTISLTSFVGVEKFKNLQTSLGVRNVEAEHLLTEHFMLYTAKNNPLAEEEAVEVLDTYAYPWIIQQEHSYEENCMILGEDEICPNSIITFQDKDSVKQAIAADLGVAVMASSFAGEDDPYVAAGLIRRVGLTDVQLTNMHVLITPRKRKFTTVERCFLEELKKFYQNLQK
ncbi:MAG: LysR family transcriptional regulator [Peptococcaceae bacterium]|nr:LysR family transcriptional regulator [Peptococcaceae bacterium]